MGKKKEPTSGNDEHSVKIVHDGVLHLQDPVAKTFKPYMFSVVNSGGTTRFVQGPPAVHRAKTLQLQLRKKKVKTLDIDLKDLDDLEKIVMRDGSGAVKGYCFLLRAGRQELNLACDNELEFDQWMRTLRQHRRLLRKESVEKVGNTTFVRVTSMVDRKTQWRVPINSNFTIQLLIRKLAARIDNKYDTFEMWVEKSVLVDGKSKVESSKLSPQQNVLGIVQQMKDDGSMRLLLNCISTVSSGLDRQKSYTPDEEVRLINEELKGIDEALAAIATALKGSLQQLLDIGKEKEALRIQYDQPPPGAKSSLQRSPRPRRTTEGTATSPATGRRSASKKSAGSRTEAHAAAPASPTLVAATSEGSHSRGSSPKPHGLASPTSHRTREVRDGKDSRESSRESSKRKHTKKDARASHRTRTDASPKRSSEDGAPLVKAGSHEKRRHKKREGDKLVKEETADALAQHEPSQPTVEASPELEPSREIAAPEAVPVADKPSVAAPASPPASPALAPAAEAPVAEPPAAKPEDAEEDTGEPARETPAHKTVRLEDLISPVLDRKEPSHNPPQSTDSDSEDAKAADVSAPAPALATTGGWIPTVSSSSEDSQPVVAPSASAELPDAAPVEASAPALAPAPAAALPAIVEAESRDEPASSSSSESGAEPTSTPEPRVDSPAATADDSDDESDSVDSTEESNQEDSLSDIESVESSLSEDEPVPVRVELADNSRLRALAVSVSSLLLPGAATEEAEAVGAVEEEDALRSASDSDSESDSSDERRDELFLRTG